MRIRTMNFPAGNSPNAFDSANAFLAGRRMEPDVWTLLDQAMGVPEP